MSYKNQTYLSGYSQYPAGYRRPPSVVVPATPEEVLLGLQAYWPFGEDTGDFLDVVGGYDLTPGTYRPEDATGHVGGATTFATKLPEFVEEEATATVTALLPSDDYTIAFWWKQASPGSSLFSFFDSLSNNLISLSHVQGIGAGTQLRLSHWDGAVAKTANTIEFDPGANTWWFVVARYDSTAGKISIQTVQSTGNWLDDAPGSTGTPTTAGALRSATGAVTLRFRSNTIFTNTLDEVGVWNRVLTDAEAAWLFNDGDGRALSLYQDLWYHWNFDGGDEATIGLESVAGFDLSCTTCPTITTPGYGGVGSALTRKASTNFAKTFTVDTELSSNTSIAARNGTGNFTIGFWAKSNVASPTAGHTMMMASSANSFWVWPIGGAGNVQLSVWDSGVARRDTPTGILLEQDVYHYFVLEYDATAGTISASRDGGSKSTTGPFGTPRAGAATGLSMVVGGTAGDYTMDEVSFWGRLLTDEERTLLSAGVKLY